jgi:hypothetical protein
LPSISSSFGIATALSWLAVEGSVVKTMTGACGLVLVGKGELEAGVRASVTLSVEALVSSWMLSLRFFAW